MVYSCVANKNYMLLLAKYQVDTGSQNTSVLHIANDGL